MTITWTTERVADVKRRFILELRAGKKPEHAARAVCCALHYLKAWRVVDAQFSAEWTASRTLPADWRAEIQTR